MATVDFLIICGRFWHRHCCQARAMRAEPNASCWMCRSVWQQSVALTDELRKQKLINNFNYCLQKQYIDNITPQW